MTLAQLKEVVAAYHEKSVADLTTGSGVDLFLVAANNARRTGELRHNFEYARITGKLSLTGAAGGDLDDAEILAGPDNGVKEVIAVLNGSGIPLDFTRFDIAAERERSSLDKFPRFRWPSDAQRDVRLSTAQIVQRGKRLLVYPPNKTDTDPFEILFEGYGWLEEYTDASLSLDYPQDFFLEFGHLYMQWAIVAELNFKFKTFVQRQEGNLASPENQAEAAWKRFTDWDSYLVTSNITRTA